VFVELYVGVCPPKYFVYAVYYLKVDISTETCHHSFIHSIGMCRMRQFLAILRSFFHSSLLYILSFHPFPPSSLPSSPTSSCHLFLGLFLSLVVSEFIYRVSQEECARLRESVPYVKLYRYNPKHLYPKLNDYGDNGQRKVRSSCGSTYCTCLADALRVHQKAQSAKLNHFFNTAVYSCAV